MRAAAAGEVFVSPLLLVPQLLAKDWALLLLSRGFILETEFVVTVHGQIFAESSLGPGLHLRLAQTGLFADLETLMEEVYTLHCELSQCLVAVAHNTVERETKLAACMAPTAHLQLEAY